MVSNLEDKENSAPGYPHGNPDDDLLSYLADRTNDPDLATSVAAVFERLNLPVPQAGEFYRTEDRGALVPLTPYGVVLRFTSNYTPHFVHGNVLQPLVSMDLGKMRVDLNPGLYTPHVCPKDAIPDYTEWGRIYNGMKADLNAHGVDVNDLNGENGGQLPAPFSDQYVFIDPGALRQLYGATRAVKALLPTLPAHDPQELLFGGLKEIFQSALAGDDNGQAVERAWAQCREMKAAGTLVANWENHDYRGTSTAASRYSERLASPPRPGEL